MDKENLNKNEENSNNINRKTKKNKTVHFKFDTKNKLLKESDKIINKKSLSKKELNNNRFGLRVRTHKSHNNLRTFTNNIQLNGLTLHDAIYLGMDLNNNNGIRANDINCYLSNTIIHQPEDSKYKIIEKNIQNKLIDISMEIFENKKSLINSQRSNKESSKKNSKKKIKKSSQKLSQIFKDLKSKNNFQKSLSIKSHEASSFLYFKEQQMEKNRKITKKKALYDSIAEDESDENIEEDGNGLNPESIFIDVFDCFLLISSLFCLFYIPYKLAKAKLIIEDSEYIVLSMIYFSEIIYIFDLIFGFFRWYYNNEFKLVKNNYMILKNYLFGHFLFDLIEAIPFYTILKYAYLNKEQEYTHNILFNENHFAIKIFICFKALKIFKINDRRNNRAFHFLNHKFSDNYLSERIFQISNFVITTLSVLNIFICFHIYIGKLSYPNWILSSKLQDSSFIDIYLASLYFILATMTSVGYGDIVCINKEETCFQILLLSIGIVAYSWIISTVGDYVKNESRATIKYNKDIIQLEEIRISYPNMPFKLYNKIHQHLERLLKQQEKYDSNILINSLPYTLKNSLLFEIHKEVITKFIFFNGCENSDFIIKVLTHFIPLISKQNAFLIKEGETIENIFFVKEGRLSLEAAIDLDNIEESVEKYLEYQFEGISSIIESGIDSTIFPLKEEKVEKIHDIKDSKDLIKIINKQTQLIGDVSYMHESHMEEEIGKCDLNGENEEKEHGNLQFLHILDVLKNENFGELYMFLNKPCPLSLRVKSKKVDLFLLRKKDALNIRKDYPNIWKRINDKAMHNMKSIKALTKKVINGYCKFNGILREKDILERSNHLFAYKENENYDNNKDKYPDKSIINTRGRSLMNIQSDIFRQKYISNNGYNPFFPKKRNSYIFSSSIIKNSKNRTFDGKKKSNIKASIKNDEINFKFEKTQKKDKHLKKKNNQKINSHQKSNNDLSLPFAQSENTINKNINKKENSKEIKMKDQNNEIKMNLNNKKEENNKRAIIDAKNIPKNNEDIENCHLSDIHFGSSVNNNFSDLFDKDNNKNIINIVNDCNNNLTIRNINLDNSKEINNKESLIPLIRNINTTNKNNLIQESTINLEFLASYKNINKMSNGIYIKNKNFQKSIQKFINYYVNINSKKRGKESSNSITSFNPFLSEVPIFNKKNSKNKKTEFDNSIKNIIINQDILNKKNSEEIKTNQKVFANTNINIENDLKNNTKISKKSKQNNLLTKLKKNNNKNNLISELKQNYNLLINPQNSNASVASEEQNKVELGKNIFITDENIFEKKEILLWNKNCNSEDKSSNNINNSNYLKFGKDFLSKKDNMIDIRELNQKLKEEKIRYNSSKNIINNKSNKNINEVNINFTNNFCRIF